MTGFTGSETSACNGLLSKGNLIPAILAITLVCPAAAIPILFELMVPFVVSIPVTFPFFTLIPVTSQF